MNKIKAYSAITLLLCMTVAMFAVANVYACTNYSASVWYNGNGSPSSHLGDSNDYYLNLDNYDIYYKGSGCWVVIGNILGATGPQGEQGIQGPQGIKGEQGEQGIQGIAGVDGIDGIDGTDGINGIDGTNGINGVNGVDGKDGLNGQDGKDGVTTIVYKNPEPESTPWLLIIALFAMILTPLGLLYYALVVRKY